MSNKVDVNVVLRNIEEYFHARAKSIYQSAEASEAYRSAAFYVKTMREEVNHEPYVCDFCGKNYGETACCDRRYEYLRLFGGYVKRPPMKDKTHDEDDTSRSD